MSEITPGQADPWQVITDVMSELLRGGQTDGIRCRSALQVLKGAGIDFDGNPVAIAAQEPHAPPEVQFAPCPVAGHDANHMQWRTHGEWLCGHVLANSLVLAGILPVPEPQPVPVPQPAPEFPAAGAALARVLSWFTGNGTRREASATRAQLARAHADGGLTVPEELRRFL